MELHRQEHQVTSRVSRGDGQQDKRANGCNEARTDRRTGSGGVQNVRAGAPEQHEYKRKSSVSAIDDGEEETTTQ